MDKKNLKPHELQERFATCGNRRIFDKELHENVSREDLPPLPPLEDGVLPMDDYSDRYNNLRLLMHDLTVPRIKETGKVRFPLFNHDFPQCETIEIFLLCYRGSDYMSQAFHKEKPDIEPRRKMLGMVYRVSYLMWGKPTIRGIEESVMAKACIKYNGLLVNGKPPKQRRAGGTVGTMINRMVQTIVADPFRYAQEK